MAVGSSRWTGSRMNPSNIAWLITQAAYILGANPASKCRCWLHNIHKSCALILGRRKARILFKLKLDLFSVSLDKSWPLNSKSLFNSKSSVVNACSLYEGKGVVNLFPPVSLNISLHLSVEDWLIHHRIFLKTGTTNALFECGKKVTFCNLYAKPS